MGTVHLESVYLSHYKQTMSRKCTRWHHLKFLFISPNEMIISSRPEYELYETAKGIPVGLKERI